MPRHDWVCQNPLCGATTEVVRTMTDCDVPPRHGCKNCGYDLYKKRMPLIQVHVPGGRSEKGNWPMVLPKMGEQRLAGIDSNGLPIVVKPDVVLQNEAEYRQYLAATDRVMLADYEDPAVTDSQHSHFAQGEVPCAPSVRAEQLAKDVIFTEDPGEIHPDLAVSKDPLPSPSESMSLEEYRKIA